MCLVSVHRDRDLIAFLFFVILTAFLFSSIRRIMGLGIYISGFVCLRWWFVCLQWWFNGYLRSRERWTDLVWGFTKREGGLIWGFTRAVGGCSEGYV